MFDLDEEDRKGTQADLDEGLKEGLERITDEQDRMKFKGNVANMRGGINAAFDAAMVCAEILKKYPKPKVNPSGVGADGKMRFEDDDDCC